jgi:hypothetical protein
LKQRITIEQLQELTEEQQQKLRKWADRDADKDVYLPGCMYLTVGQMIELIESKDDCINITKMLTDIDGKQLWGWEITLRHIKKWYAGIELADVLWQTVKEVL